MNQHALLLAAFMLSPSLALASRGEPTKKDISETKNEGLIIDGKAQGLGTTGKKSAGDPEAAIYGKDNRKGVQRKRYPYSAVLELTSEYSVTERPGICLATLVSECHAVTARHCVISHEAEAMNKSRKAQGLGEDEMFPVRATFVEVKDGLGNKARVTDFEAGASDSPADDYALLRLDRKLGKRGGFVGYLKKSAKDFEVGSRYVVVGRALDKTDGKKLFSDDTAKVVFEQPAGHILKLRADTYIGDSGGPVFPIFEDKAYLVAIVSKSTVSKAYENGKKLQAAFSDRPPENRQGSYLTTSRFYGELKSFMKQHPCR
jgi:V8-like Glu-specific endopeptidase